MLDFQKLMVYQKAREAHKEVLIFLRSNKNVYSKLKDQLLRASLSVMLNIAEGSGRYTNADKRHYFHQSRGSAFETLACLEACLDLGDLTQSSLNEFQIRYEEISKMLYGMAQRLK